MTGVRPGPRRHVKTACWLKERRETRKAHRSNANCSTSSICRGVGLTEARFSKLVLLVGPDDFPLVSFANVALLLMWPQIPDS